MFESFISVTVPNTLLILAECQKLFQASSTSVNPARLMGTSIQTSSPSKSALVSGQILSDVLTKFTPSPAPLRPSSATRCQTPARGTSPTRPCLRPSYITNRSNHPDKCPLCGESKNLSTARFAHVRLGLNKAPEMIMCRYKPTNEIVSGILAKMLTLNKILNTDLNTARITNMSPILNVEVELRMNPHMSAVVYKSMESGFFGRAESGSIREEINPGIKLAISNEYEFRDEITGLEYYATMNELRIDVISFSSKVKFIGVASHQGIRLVIIQLVDTVGGLASLRGFINSSFVDEIRNVDYDVVGIKNLDVYKGLSMLKANGIKVQLTVLSYTIARSHSILVPITCTLNVLTAEITVDGSVVFINKLCVDRNVVKPTKPHVKRPMTEFEKPHMIIRKCWKSASDVPKNPVSSMNHDGLACMTMFRTLRLKKPIIDILSTNGVLCTREGSNLITMAHGHPRMVEGSIYEISVDKSRNLNEVTLSNPVERLMKDYV
ncbi:hypothetical protein P153DRAFT_391143 [Dothidotthia symphoricarpi CBS 119687]|uniref:Uncharacterized protein n=1 Tax=Dothidotthia symphoricarpi CBS 119687 TaxID=1392245 RepID=A0A6A5ZWQ3_9PLEO|nr:uncharacterized protein P153DRAFT_391143 [Dothidotthia symphoricarpi CBS 119687]KAF2123726.1 hypothetical protein P153DRAFT_391143 [Dothidotthia symphoricarpi CBS 119687]